jgi:hypothetical protein
MLGGLWEAHAYSQFIGEPGASGRREAEEKEQEAPSPHLEEQRQGSTCRFSKLLSIYD